MGGCLTRMKAEMKAPPPRPGNWEGLSPQRPEQYVPPRRRESERAQMQDSDSGNGAPLRKETQSGIPGLTYDQAGRPVWREENAVQTEHRERI